jgi:hypothetical protein
MKVDKWNINWSTVVSRTNAGDVDPGITRFVIIRKKTQSIKRGTNQHVQPPYKRKPVEKPSTSTETQIEKPPADTNHKSEVTPNDKPDAAPTS